MARTNILILFLLAEVIQAVVPQRPVLQLSYSEGYPLLSWASPSIRNPEKITAFRLYRTTKGGTAVLLGEYPKVRSRSQEVTDTTLTEGEAIYVLRAVNADGESEPSLPQKAVLKSDLAVDGPSLVSQNPNLCTSKMYPCVGEKVTFGCFVRNEGAKISAPVKVRINCQEKNIGEYEIPAIAPGEKKQIFWSLIPAAAGEYEQRIVVDEEMNNDDGNRNNNILTVKAAAVRRDLYSVWYGNVLGLPYSNCGQCNQLSQGEWHRRGGMAVAVAGTGEKALDEYRKLASPDSGFDAVCIDEICGYGDSAKVLARQLPILKKEFPAFKVFVWTIGEDTADEIAELVKGGIIDLLLFEVYVKPGDSIDPLRKAAENIRRRGLQDKALMGLVTNREWDNFAGAEAHQKSVVEQMRLVHQLLPEMPGFAFWSDDALPGVIEAADQEYYQLLIKH